MTIVRSSVIVLCSVCSAQSHLIDGWIMGGWKSPSEAASPQINDLPLQELGGVVGIKPWWRYETKITIFLCAVCPALRCSRQWKHDNLLVCSGPRLNNLSSGEDHTSSDFFFLASPRGRRQFDWVRREPSSSSSGWTFPQQHHHFAVDMVWWWHICINTCSANPLGSARREGGSKWRSNDCLNGIKLLLYRFDLFTWPVCWYSFWSLFGWLVGCGPYKATFMA